MKLYDLEPSGNCYKVRLFCALAKIPIDLVPVDLMAGEHKSAKILAMNPLGELPILDDNGYILRDSQAILVYLASKRAAKRGCQKTQHTRQKSCNGYLPPSTKCNTAQAMHGWRTCLATI